MPRKRGRPPKQASSGNSETNEKGEQQPSKGMKEKAEREKLALVRPREEEDKQEKRTRKPKVFFGDDSENGGEKNEDPTDVVDLDDLEADDEEDLREEGDEIEDDSPTMKKRTV